MVADSVTLYRYAAVDVDLLRRNLGKGLCDDEPVTADRTGGDLRRPRRYHRRLLHVFCLSARVAARCSPASKALHQRKRAEGKSHRQAVPALARRRLEVLWALIRDQRTFTAEPPAATSRRPDLPRPARPATLTTTIGSH